MSFTHPSGHFDNSAADYGHIDARPLASAMGAEILGVDLRNLNDTQFAEIEHALFRHKMIFFREQAIDHSDQEAFSLRFGPFAADAYGKGMEGHPNVHAVIKEADARKGMIFGSGWHTDSPFLPEPPAITLLRGVDIPPYGGDTIWVNTALAYRALSPVMQGVLQDLKVHMSMGKVVASLRALDPDWSGQVESAPDTAAKVAGSFHPLVRTHPKTGERGLYCDATYASGIEGMTQPEADALLEFLRSHITQAAFSCRLRWEVNTVAVWDNRLCLHQAFNDFDGFRRELYRTTVTGEAPA